MKFGFLYKTSRGIFVDPAKANLKRYRAKIDDYQSPKFGQREVE